MNKTTDQMTTEEKIELLRQRCQEWATKPAVSFGKAPKDGWKESDRIVK